MTANPVVETTAGKVRGFSNRGISTFLGIPYGASTTGANRFVAPVKPDPWPGVRNCLIYGHSCPQGGTGVSAGGFGHPQCINTGNQNALPAVRP